MKTKTRIGLVTGISVLMIFVGSLSYGAEALTHAWWRVGFETPVAFSDPIRLGLGAVALVSPPDKGLGQGHLEITLVEVPKDLQESMGNNETEIMTYVKSTFLGTAKQAESVREQTFMGQTVKGDVQRTTIPKPGELEIYLVTLSGGDKVAIGLSRDLNVPGEEAKKVMDMVARTFKEIPEK